MSICQDWTIEKQSLVTFQLIYTRTASQRAGFLCSKSQYFTNRVDECKIEHRKGFSDLQLSCEMMHHLAHPKYTCVCAILYPTRPEHTRLGQIMTSLTSKRHVI